MSNELITILCSSIVILFILGLLIWATDSMLKQSSKDWQTLEHFEKRAKEVKTKEEIETFHHEFSEKAIKINNPLINPRLAKIDGYLRGLYQQYKK